MIESLFRWAGLSDPSSAWYLFWSGIGGDLTILGAVAQFYRSKTCDIKRCFRVARYKVRDTEWTVCGKHSPNKRPTVQDLIQSVPGDVLPDDVPPEVELES